MPAPQQEVAFEVDGERYTLAFDFAAIAHFEQLSDLSLVDALAAMEQAQKDGRSPKISHLGYLMQAGFRRHHPDMPAEDALRLAMDPRVQEQLGLAVAAAFGGDDAGNPTAPAKPRAKAAPSTGKKSSRARSKQA